MTAIVTAAIVAGRALFPIGRFLVRHMWDKAKGICSKVDDMEQIEISEEMAIALQAQQLQQQPQTTTVATPSNSKVKVNAEGELKIYSDSSKVTPDLLENFDKASGDTNDATEPVACQFGPPTPPIATAAITQEQHDIAQSKRNSIAYGKGQNRLEANKLKDFDDWGYTCGA